MTSSNYDNCVKIDMTENVHAWWWSMIHPIIAEIATLEAAGKKIVPRKLHALRFCSNDSKAVKLWFDQAKTAKAALEAANQQAV